MCYFQGIQGPSGPPGAKGIAGEPVSLLSAYMNVFYPIIKYLLCGFLSVFAPCGLIMYFFAESLKDDIGRYHSVSLSIMTCGSPAPTVHPPSRH